MPEDSGEVGAVPGDAPQRDAGREDADDIAAVQERSWQIGAGQHGPGGWDVPWPESPATGAGTPGRADLELAFATAMRRTGRSRAGARAQRRHRWGQDRAGRPAPRRARRPP